MAEKEYIEREAVMLQINAADFIRDDNYEAGATLLFQDDVVGRISSIPAADVRPVVLCRDCKYCRRVDEFEYWCDGFCSSARLVRKDDFCSHGSRHE